MADDSIKYTKLRPSLRRLPVKPLGIRPSDKAVLGVIADTVTWTTWAGMVKTSDIARWTGYGATTITGCVERLTAAGLIEVNRTRRGYVFTICAETIMGHCDPQQMGTTKTVNHRIRESQNPGVVNHSSWDLGITDSGDASISGSSSGSSSGSPPPPPTGGQWGHQVKGAGSTATAITCSP